MQLPKNRRRQKLVEKKCQYKGCGKVFFGIAIAKYCLEHRKDEYRIRKRPVYKSIKEDNSVIEHNFLYATDRISRCALAGCNNKFRIKILPRQKIYPKYCEEHRNEFKRAMFIKLSQSSERVCA